MQPSAQSLSVFVGRQREMAELRAALDEAMSGHGRLVMLAGEPGIGKTRTAQELASQARMLGTQVQPRSPNISSRRGPQRYPFSAVKAVIAPRWWLQGEKPPSVAVVARLGIFRMPRPLHQRRRLG